MQDYDLAELDRERAAQWREDVRAARQEARDFGAASEETAITESNDSLTSAIKHRLDPRAIAAGVVGGPMGWIILAVWKTLGWVHKK